MKEMVKFSTSENLKSNKIYLDNWRPDEKDSNWSKSVNFIELEPKCRLETFFDENFEKPMGTWRGGYDMKGVHQAWISFIRVKVWLEIVSYHAGFTFFNLEFQTPINTEKLTNPSI